MMALDPDMHSIPAFAYAIEISVSRLRVGGLLIVPSSFNTPQ